MNNKIINYLCIFISFGLLIYFFINSYVFKESIINSSKLYLYNVLPSLFISSIIINLLNQTNLDYIIYKYTHNIYIYILIISFLVGVPTNIILIKDLYNKNYITKDDISYILCFTSINNPLFIYNFTSIIFNTKIAIIYILIIYLINTLIYLMVRKKLSFKKITLLNKYNISLTKVIKDASINQIPIFGTILFFKLVIDLLRINNNCLISGLIEITSGLNCLMVNNSYNSYILPLFIILFNSLSIHIQISNILPENINYKYFYICKYIILIIIIIIYHSY